MSTKNNKISRITGNLTGAKLTLVGAGPGDLELITVKGLKALRDAQVVLYDALVNPELLNYTHDEAIKIFVGKRAGVHEYSQEKINKLIVHYALQYGHVVRLKGGDSFVFGRGMEEIKYAESFGIPADIVPGISSSIGVPALQGIPVTHRGLSESFWVITGTTTAGTLSNDVYVAAKTGATAVILMGVSKLKEIVNAYISEGKEELPIAVIQNGSLENEKVALGRIANIEEEVKANGIGAPAIIIIGKVVALHPWYEVLTAVENRN